MSTTFSLTFAHQPEPDELAGLSIVNIDHCNYALDVIERIIGDEHFTTLMKDCPFLSPHKLSHFKSDMAGMRRPLLINGTAFNQFIYKASVDLSVIEKQYLHAALSTIPVAKIGQQI